MSMSMLSRVIFPPPPSLIVSVMSVVSLVGIAGIGVREILGTHLHYSKFSNLSSENKSTQIKLSSRTGMLVAYSPAFLSAVASFWLFPNHGDLRLCLVKATLTIHFLKRIIEVLFVHKFGTSGAVLDSAIVISSSYFSATSTMIYGQYLTREFPEPPVDLKYPGILLFLLGVVGNWHHHHLLAALRRRDDGDGNGYKIPRGGLFGLVICPHYLFEALVFIGISFISQTWYSFCFTVGTIVYFVGRSYATRRWYLSKFEDFPKHVKALIPYVF